MEAMIVSPTPGPNALKPKSKNEAQSGSESMFAPALNQAINDKNSSTSQPPQKSRISRSEDANSNTQDDLKNADTTGKKSVQHHGDHQLVTNNKPVDTTEVTGEKYAASAKEAAALLNTGDGNSIAGKVVTSSALANQTDKALINQSSKESVITAQFTQIPNGSSGVPAEQLLAEQTGKTGNTVYLHNNDTITWNQTKANASNMLANNTTLLQSVSKENAVAETTPVRVERFTALAEMSGQKNAEPANTIPSLSAEKIAAKLTDLPSQNANFSTPLRDNGPSLRQDPHEQFIDAKLGYIEKKQHSQTDQQSLNGDSDSSQKNSFTASPKTIERTNETSFSQSFQNVSTDKPTTSGIDTARPGGSLFTPHVQENNILHQVIHKFRISQHLQDSRLVMKLHPAELGDLKIDVQLKDGSINANILAQTRQAQDILEKNMPRLKALMEEQGLMVSEITINLDTELSDNNNLFEDHLAQDDRSFSNRKNVTSSLQFELEHEEGEEVEFGAQPAPSGVNVMI